jgi:hypothetical protein
VISDLNCLVNGAKQRQSSSGYLTNRYAKFIEAMFQLC